MGCWNGTCGLTKLPIKMGEKIVLIPIIKGIEGMDGLSCGGFCYSTDIYEPLTTPLIGVYDDYGSIEEVENGDIVFNFFMTKYKKEIEAVVETKKEAFPKTIEDVINFVERGYLQNLSFMMFHESVYRRVIEEYACRKPYEKEFTIKEHIEKQALRYIEKTKAIDPNDKYLRMFGFIENSFSNGFKRKMRYFLDQLIVQEDNRLLNDMVDLYLFNSAFETSRHAWMPQCGAGSQSAEYMLQKVIADFVIEKEAAVRKEYQEENEPEEDMVDEHELTRETLFVFCREEDEYED